MGRNVEDILEECLSRLAGGEGVADCAARYPEHQDELVPLLETAAMTISAASSIAIRPEAKAKGLDRLTAAVAQGGGPKNRWLGWLSWMQSAPKPAVASLAVLVLATGTAVGTGVVSSDSVPGEPLYWVKAKKEDLSLMFPQSDISRAQAHARLATERAHEMRQLADVGRFEDVETLVKGIRHHLSESAGYAQVQTVSNTIEMPASPSWPFPQRELVELRISLQREMDLLRAHSDDILQTLPPDERFRAYALWRRSELDFLTMIKALEGSPFVTQQPFWIIEEPRTRQVVR